MTQEISQYGVGYGLAAAAHDDFAHFVDSSV